MSSKKPTLRKTLARGLTFIVLGIVVTALLLTACAWATPAPAPEPVVTRSYTITGVAVVDVEKGIVRDDLNRLLDEAEELTKP